MGRRKKGEPPAYRKHEASNQAYSFLNGKQVYFGKYGTRESRQAYAKFVRNWERSHGGEIIADASKAKDLEGFAALYVTDLIGAVSDVERQDVKRNLGMLTSLYGAFDPDEFRGAELKALRAAWIEAGHMRVTINKAIGRVRRFFRWMVAEEYCEPDTLAILEAVPDIPSGKMPDNPPVQPVSIEDVLKSMAVMEEPAKWITAVQLYGVPGRPRRARCAAANSSAMAGRSSGKTKVSGPFFLDVAVEPC